MNNPVSTYRLQFHRHFSFDDFEQLIPYFQKLGIGTIYASPVLQSTSGSTHGYDGVNPRRIDPELGTLEKLRDLSHTLRESGINWLQDIVPNHMAFHPENPWLMDVLEKGMQSVYASYFDIAWNSRLFHGKLMVPFLAKGLDEVIDADGVQVRYADKRFVIAYEGLLFPLNLRSYMQILETVTNRPEPIGQLLTQFREMNAIEDAHAYSERWDEGLLQLRALSRNEEVMHFIDEALRIINGDKKLLRQIADQQSYVLCHWQRTEEQINFRRFFTVNGLICLNMQNDQVFGQYHQLIGELVAEGVFQGLRIDHVDGLYDPAGYLEKLRKLVGVDSYLVVEKILEKSEHLPQKWPIQGATGYEFLAMVNNLLTHSAAEQTLTTFYQELIGDNSSAHEHLIRKKSEILHGHMAGELENLFRLFVELELTDPDTLEQIGNEPMREVIGEFLIHCPVYRYYGNAMPLPDEEIRAVKNILIAINKYHLDLSPAVEILEQCFIHRPALEDEAYNRRAAEFYQRCMQFTGPLMAKGGEDTLMYTYNRFIGHNEVGDFPDRFGISVKHFHAYMRRRQKEWPLALNTTATHDTKRGEDVRARLNVLTDLSDEWITTVQQWQKLNAALKKEGEGPDANDEYLIYQTLEGAHPLAGADEDNFPERLTDYLQKALREAKTHTTWSAPNEAYEGQVKAFTENLLKPETPFFKSFHHFLNTVTDFGIINSLMQVVLKFTCPGVPDVYQGGELWDFSLVDPDNRRPVDFGKRKQWLAEFDAYEPERLFEKLWEERQTGRIKLWLTRQLFQFRQRDTTLFEKGEYMPLKVRGAYKTHLLAFVRKRKKNLCVVVIPLHPAILCKAQQKTFFELDWKDTHVVLPDHVSADWDDVLSGEKKTWEGNLWPGEIFANLPVAILQGSKVDHGRNAGVLLHITSLASPFGIGDMGPQAYAFADFLEQGNQKIWQILPLNPTEQAQGNSPYSALSSRAGNPLLISPELLAEDGWLPEEELTGFHLPSAAQADYSTAGEIKGKLLERAFQQYRASETSDGKDAFDGFVLQNSEWLEDFAIYMALKSRFKGKSWYEWPEEFKNRNQATLEEIARTEADTLYFIKWQQYVFDQQWKRLRTYCNDREIQFLGDIPFYVSYDSADVWANREIFCVAKDGRITGMAGVPPDSFSEDGQLWGMPVFNWAVLKEQGYQWWIDRLAKNIELFDRVRLDHFRAFVDYWEVPGGEKTAVKGVWRHGPCEDFFQKVQAALGDLPFVAEDLGEMGPEVNVLRDQFDLPGMKVLQFAFEDDMPLSDHIPHHYKTHFVAYTGTHDNNTARGWFTQAEGVRERMEEYLGKSVSEDTAYADMARLIYASVAETAIMPIQDVLNLDENAKMNLPGSNENNWLWRLLPGQLTSEAARFLAELTVLYNRY